MSDVQEYSNKAASLAPFAELNRTIMEDASAEDAKVRRVSIMGGRFTLCDTVGELIPPNPNKLDFVIAGIKAPPSRIYFSGGYSPGDLSPPECYSYDGVAPEPNVQAPQSKSCASCPMARFDAAVSKVTGKGVPLCKTRKVLAIKIIGVPGLWQFAIPAASIKRCWNNVYSKVTRIINTENAKHKKPVLGFLNIVIRAEFDTSDKRIGILKMEPVGYLPESEAASVAEAVQDADEINNLLWGQGGTARKQLWLARTGRTDTAGSEPLTASMEPPRTAARPGKSATKTTGHAAPARTVDEIVDLLGGDGID